MNNIKEQEQKLLESLVRLDTITDLVANSRKKIIDLEEVKKNLEKEKKDLKAKLSTLEKENHQLKSKIDDLDTKLQTNNNDGLKEKISTIEEENEKLKNEIKNMEKDLENSKYKIIKNQQNREEIAKKLDELNQETENIFGDKEW